MSKEDWALRQWQKALADCKYYDENDKILPMRGDMRKVKKPNGEDGYIVFEGDRWFDMEPDGTVEFNIIDKAAEEDDKRLRSVIKEGLRYVFGESVDEKD